jgi:triacylglycerol lipase
MGAPPTYPIVLAHGIARFDVLSNHLFKIDNSSRDDGLHYFRNIRTHLESHGFVVRHSGVEWAAGVVVRSCTLRRNIENVLVELGSRKVHVIAHSMGGLDARQMLFDGREAGFHERVASLTTLATPHHGSPAADAFLPLAPQGGVLGIDVSGLCDLTTTTCRAFNAEKRDWERTCGVLFQAYAGAQPFRGIFSPLKATWAIIHAKEGDNDGLVSVRSAMWNDEYFVPPVINADHLNIVGWWNPSDVWRGEAPLKLEARVKSLYLAIAQRLAQRFPT